MKTLKKELVSIGRQYAGRDDTIDYYHEGKFSEAIADHIQRQTETLLARNEPLLAFQARVDALREYSDYSIDDSNGEYGLVMETMEDMYVDVLAIADEIVAETVYGSLAIEQNTLTLDQVTAVLNGKRVLVPPKDIAEVRNAFEIYERLETLNPYSIDDLLTAHGVMMRGLEQEAGEFRSRPVGVVNQAGEIVHFGTLPQYVPEAVDEQPQFPGGDNALMRYINQERRYPREAYCAGIEGRVLCSFIVDSDGSVSNVEVLRGVDESLNREAVRIISGMPRWKAGTIDGGNVPVYYVLSIPFRR